MDLAFAGWPVLLQVAPRHDGEESVKGLHGVLLRFVIPVLTWVASRPSRRVWCLRSLFGIMGHPSSDLGRVTAVTPGVVSAWFAWGPATPHMEALPH